VQRISTSLQRDLNDQFRLLGHLESLAQIEAGKSPSQAETLNLSAAVIASVERFSPQASMLGVRLFPRVDFASPPVVADPVQLSIILDHLIEQAVRKEDSGGAVLIETLGRGHEVQVNVANSGSLARPRQANRTVELIITRRLIELNGGRVWTAQPLTGGAVTSFTLPIATGQFSE